MDYWLSEEQQLIQSSVHEFLTNECGPERVRAAYDSEQTFDAALWKGLAELGLTGTCIPSEHGGTDLGLLEAALLSEELGRHAAPLFLEGHLLAGLAIATGGTDAQKANLLPKLASGEQIGTLALASRESRASWCDWTVAPGGSGTSSASLVPMADVADVLIVGCQGGQLGILESQRANLVTRSAHGLDQSRHLFEISFDQAAVEPLPELPGEVLCDALITLLAADAFGAANKLVEITVAYAMEREQFGLPIAQFQSVKHKLAECALGALTGRGLFWKAAGEFDRAPAKAARSASMAKAHITDQATRVAREAVELHGGVGFTWECDVHPYFKRAMFDRNYLGTPELHRERCARLAGWSR